MAADLRDDLRAAFRWTDPGCGADYLVSDRSKWWRDPAIISGLGEAIAELFADARPTVVVSPEVTGFLLGPLVVSPEVTGFLLGPLLARALGAGFVEALRAGVRDRQRMPARGDRRVDRPRPAHRC